MHKINHQAMVHHSLHCPGYKGGSLGLQQIGRVHGPPGFFPGGANSEASQGLKGIAYLSSVYSWNTVPKPAVIFHSVERDLRCLCVRFCAWIVFCLKTEKRNPGGCKCTTLHLPAGALGRV